MSFDERALIDYVTSRRWYGAKSRTVAHSQLLDSVVLRTAEPHFALALVEMRYDTGAHDIYQLVYALRGDRLEVDALDDPAAARELVHAMRSGLTLQGVEGVIEFRPIEGFAGLGRELAEARSVGAEQSNTSIVFDDELILKVFRRLEAGINPELEMRTPEVPSARRWGSSRSSCSTGSTAGASRSTSSASRRSASASACTGLAR
jgi:predicted trehalose synthase